MGLFGTPARRVHHNALSAGSPGGANPSYPPTTSLTDNVQLAEPATISGGHSATAVIKALAAKQPSTVIAGAPDHTQQITEADALVVRLDAVTTFATSIAANQPAASTVDRIKAYLRAGDNKWAQFLEVEGRALPAASYFHSWLAHLVAKQVIAPGFDSALVNTTQGFGTYNFAGYFGPKVNIRAEVVSKATAFTGVGAQSAFTSNDGIAGAARYRAQTEKAIGPTFIARNFGSGAASIRASGVLGFLLAGTSDLNAGLTIKAGGRAYTTEEINDVEDRINLFLLRQGGSITGSFGSSVRGVTPPQDPFTGASVFMFSDLFDTPIDIEIVVGTAQTLQLAAIVKGDIGSIGT